jgi:hypothetical protein
MSACPPRAAQERTFQHRRFGPIVLQKSFYPLFKNFPGCRRGFRVNMWGTSSHDDELTGNLANELDAISIDDRGLLRLFAEKSSRDDLGLGSFMGAQTSLL